MLKLFNHRFGFHYWEIQAGLLRRLSFTPTGQARRAKYVKMHSAFDEKTMQNDIAMIKVDEPFRFNRWIRPTCLPLPESNGSDVATPNTTCVAVGWGSTAEESPAGRFKFLNKGWLPAKRFCITVQHLL